MVQLVKYLQTPSTAMQSMRHQAEGHLGSLPVTAVSERAVQADRGTASFVRSNKIDSSTDRSVSGGAPPSSKRDVNFCSSDRVQVWTGGSSCNLDSLAKENLREVVKKDDTLHWVHDNDTSLTQSARGFVTLGQLSLRSPQSTWFVSVGSTKLKLKQRISVRGCKQRAKKNLVSWDKVWGWNY